MSATHDPRLLLLHPQDNVLIAVRTLEAGDELNLGVAKVPVAVRIVVGHKLAARRIAAGEKILKWGAPIGSATRDIAAGEHVHTHNMQSDYIPTYDKQGGQRHGH